MSNNQPPKTWKERLAQEQAKQKELLAKGPLPADVPAAKWNPNDKERDATTSASIVVALLGSVIQKLSTGCNYETIEFELRSTKYHYERLFATILPGEPLNAQPVAMWVKAHGGMPAGIYSMKLVSEDNVEMRGTGMVNHGVIQVITFLNKSTMGIDDLPKDYEGVYYLDESGAAANELEQLRQWKIEAVDLLTSINAYVHKHMECNIGDSCVELVLERCRQFDDLKAKGDKLALALRRCSGSIKVHPDYMGGENIEFVDRVAGAEEALAEWSGEKETIKGGMPALDQPILSDDDLKAWEDGEKEVKP